MEFLIKCTIVMVWKKKDGYKTEERRMKSKAAVKCYALAK